MDLFELISNYFCAAYFLKCRAVAAVVLGDPTKFEIFEATYSTRFDKLNNREVDLLMAGVSHTIEREVREVSKKQLICFLLIVFSLTNPNLIYFIPSKSENY